MNESDTLNALGLAGLVLLWWEEHQYDTSSDDGEEYNVYGQPPLFVKEAQKILEASK